MEAIPSVMDESVAEYLELTEINIDLSDQKWEKEELVTKLQNKIYNIQ